MIGDAVDRATDRVGDRVTDILLSYIMKVVLAVIAFVLFLGVLVCACIAIYWSLEPTYGPMASVGIIAGGLGVAGLLFAVLALAAGQKPSLAGTVKPVEVAREESREVVETVGPYKFVAGALGVGALAGGLLRGRRHSHTPSNEASTISTLLGLLPTAISAVTMVNTHFAAKSSENAARASEEAAAEARGSSGLATGFSEPPGLNCRRVPHDRHAYEQYGKPA